MKHTYFHKDPANWDLETIKRHENLPYFKCRNFSEFKKLVKGKRTRDIILEMCDRIVKKHNPDAIILFGSYATGNSDRHSDVDLLIMFKRKLDTFNTSMQMMDTVRTSPIKTDLVVVSRDELLNWSWVKSTVYNQAFKDGFHLYEKGSKLANYYLKKSKEALVIAKEDFSVLNTAMYFGRRSLLNAMYAAITFDGKDFPKQKWMEEILMHIDKSWGVAKFKHDLENFPRTGKLNRDEIKFVSNFFNIISKEFKSRKASIEFQ